MKVGDLVKYSDAFVKGYSSKLISLKVQSLIGIISHFDEDDDPIVFWLRENREEANYRSHIKVISEC